MDEGEHVVQKAARRAHKGLPLQILLLPGALPHEKDGSPGIARAKNHVVPRLPQDTFLTGGALRPDGLPAVHGPLPLFHRFSQYTTQEAKSQREEILKFPLDNPAQQAYNTAIQAKAMKKTAPREGRQRIRVTD